MFRGMNALVLLLSATLALDPVLDAAERAGADGVLLVRRGDTVLYERAWGFASCDRKERMTTGHAFDIGSITKVLTGVAALKTLPLDLKVGDVFPDAPPDKRTITVEQLLMHRSGLPDSIGLDETLINRTFFLEKLFARPLGEPRYSNAGYSLLAAMIEVRTGRPYAEALREHVTRTIGQQRRPGLACGTLRGLAWGSTADYFGPDGPGWYLRGAGGLLASVRELDDWFDALWEGRVLDAEKTALVRDALTRRDKSGRRLLLTSGANTIFSSHYERWPDEDVVFILFTSDSEWPKERLLPELRPAIIELAARR